MKLGFTGTQHGMTGSQLAAFRKLVAKLKPKEFHHGDCVGSDATAHAAVAGGTDALVVVHPPTDTKKSVGTKASRRIRVLRPKPYLSRNHDIVDACDRLVATPSGVDEVLRSGTWSTVRYARKVGKPITFVWPDGTVTQDDIEM